VFVSVALCSVVPSGAVVLRPLFAACCVLLFWLGVLAACCMRIDLSVWFIVLVVRFLGLRDGVGTAKVRRKLEC
jgi:hypothetical protein